MNLDNLNKWLSLAANVGVVGGIVFLAMEVRQNNLMAELQQQATETARVTALVDMVVESPDLVDLLETPMDSLDSSQLARLELLGIRLLMGFEDSYRASRDDPEAMEASARNFSAIYSRPVLNYGAPLAWETYKARADPEFVRWFETNVVGR